MNETPPLSPRPNHPPLRHEVPQHREPRADPFAHGEKPMRDAAMPEERDPARGGTRAALLGALVLICVGVLLAALFTGLFR